MSSTPRKRKKRKAESESEDEDDQPEQVLLEEEKADEDFKPKKKKKKREPVKPKTDPAEWPSKDILTLFERIEGILPKVDVMKYTRRLERLDWDKVTFGDYSTLECSTVFNTMIKRVRQNQNVSDLVVNMKSMYNRQPKLLQGSMLEQCGPKKPLTSYFLFLQDKKKKLQRKNPNLTLPEISKILGEKYKNLSDRKRQKYTDRYHANLETYKEEVAKLREEHPDWASSVNDGKTPKCPSPSALFIEDKMAKLMESDPEMTNKQAHDKAALKWKKLKDRKKLKWINRAVRSFEGDYQEQCAQYQRLNPNFVPKTTCLSKAEQHLKDVSEGMPEKPPQSGFMLFKKSQYLERRHPGVNFSVLNNQLNQEWQSLDKEEKEKYNKKVKKAKMEYSVAFQQYMASLSDDKRQQLLQRALRPGGSGINATTKNKKTIVNGEVEDDESDIEIRSSPDSCQSKLPEPIRSALSFYIEEQCKEMIGSDSDTSESDLTLSLTKKFKQLPEEEKEKYRKMAAKQRKHTLMSNLGTGVSPKTKKRPSGTTKKSVKKKFPGEPSKPPASGYMLFSSKMREVHGARWMSVAANKWKEMSDDEKARYNSKAKKKAKKYEEEVDAFKQTLPPSELTEFEQVLASRRKEKSSVKMTD